MKNFQCEHMSDLFSITEQKEIAESYLQILGKNFELSRFKSGDVMVAREIVPGLIQLQSIHSNRDLKEKMIEIEKHFDSVCYYVIGCDTEYGYMYNFLLTSNYVDDHVFRQYAKNIFYVWSYVWNKDHEELSEPGMITIISDGIQPLRRVI